MKKQRIILFAALFAMGTMTTACVGDLQDISPIDPNLEKPEDVLNSKEAYYQVLAKCYMGLATSGSKGPDSDPDIDGINGGYGQYVRALFYMNELTTDEAVIGWNDQTVQNLHGMNWTPSDVFITCMFARVSQQISICNEFIRKAGASEYASDEEVKIWIAEARALRALSYLHAIDMFGTYPFTDESSPVGQTAPGVKTRAELCTWLEAELDEITPLLKAEKTNLYGRCDRGLAKMLKAKLLLNSEVYTGTPRWAECATVCKDIMTTYGPLHGTFKDLFCADNHLCTDEIIFAVEQDHVYTQSYGCTNFIVFGSVGADDATSSADLNISKGWGGMRITPEFGNLYSAEDVRGMIYKTGHTEDIVAVGEFTNGWCLNKFTNVNHDGTKVLVEGVAPGFVDTDFPVYRTADAYLMLAECAKRDSSVSAAEGLAAWKAVRERAGITTGNDAYTLDDVIKERGRELAWECHRRSDLIRFDMFTTDKYLWQWKGNTHDGQAVDSYRNLLPIPTNDLNTNSNLKQNEGYN